jgi:hypothetical protein
MILNTISGSLQSTPASNGRWEELRYHANVNVKHKPRVTCTVEARDIKEAARKIRRMYANHQGFSLSN